MQLSEQQQSRVREIYEEEKQKGVGAKNRTISRVKKELDLVLSERHIRYYAIEKKKIEIIDEIEELREELEATDEEVEEVQIDSLGNHTITFQGDRVTFERQFVDTLFWYYSNKGKNFSGEKMRQTFSLTAEDWHAFKTQFGLYKDSHVFSDWSRDNLPEEELNAMILRANQARSDTIRDKFIVTDHIREKKELVSLRKRNANVDYELERIAEFVKRYKPKPIQIDVEALPSNGRCSIVISDIHWGNGNTERIDERWAMITNYLVNCPQTEIDLLVLGDLFESIAPGGMHPGQERRQDLHGFALWQHVGDELEAMIKAIAEAGKTVSFHGIGGNHDRIGKNHDEDQERFAALTIYSLVQARVQNIAKSFQFYQTKINKVDIGDVQYILHHGDDGFDKRKPEIIAWNNGAVNGKPVVILHGDKHSGKFSEVKGITMIQIPALAGRGEYDTRLDLHSQPGFVILEENKHNQVDVSFKRLPQ